MTGQPRHRASGDHSSCGNIVSITEERKARPTYYCFMVAKSVVLSWAAVLAAILVVLATALLRWSRQLAAAPQAGRLERRQPQAVEAWQRVVRTFLRLLSRRRAWHNLGEHLKLYSNIRSATRRHGITRAGAAADQHPR